MNHKLKQQEMRSEKTSATNLNSLSYAVFFTLCFASLASDNPTFFILSLMALSLVCMKIIMHLVHQKNKLQALRSLAQPGVLYLFDQIRWQQKQVNLSAQSAILRILFHPSNSEENLNQTSRILHELLEDTLQKLSHLFFTDYKLGNIDIKASLHVENNVRPTLTALQLFIWIEEYLKPDLEKRTHLHTEISQFISGLNQAETENQDKPQNSQSKKPAEVFKGWVYILDFAWVDQSMYLDPENPHYSLRHYDEISMESPISLHQNSENTKTSSTIVLHRRVLQQLKKEAPKVHAIILSNLTKISENLSQISMDVLKNLLNFESSMQAMKKQFLSSQIRENMRLFFKNMDQEIEDVKSTSEWLKLLSKLDRLNFVGRMEKDEAILQCLTILKKSLESLTGDNSSKLELAWKIKQRCIYSVNKIGYPGQRYQMLLEEKYSHRKSTKLFQALSHPSANIHIPAWNYLACHQDFENLELSRGDLFRYLNKIHTTESFQENSTFVLSQAMLTFWDQCKYSQPAEFHLAEECFTQLLQLCKNFAKEEILVLCLDLFQDLDPKSYKIDAIKTARKKFEVEYKNLKDKTSLLNENFKTPLNKAS